MSYDLSDDHPMKGVAVKFGRELRRALENRGVGWRQMNEAMGRDVHSSLDRYKSGRNLPRLEHALEMAEALAWPMLAQIVRDARTLVCPVDGRTFVWDIGHAQTYCSPKCRSVAANERARMHGLMETEARGYAKEDPERVLVARLKQELTRTRQLELARARRAGNPNAGGAYVSRREIRAAIKQWEQTSSQSRHRRTKNELSAHTAAVDRFCRGCEPEGLCRDNECPLRPVSPLKYVPMHDVALAARSLTRSEVWRQPGSDERRRQQSIRGMQMHAQPGRKEQLAAATRSWWSGLTPEERVAHIAKTRSKLKGVEDGHRLRPCGCRYRRHADDCPLRREAEDAELAG